MKKNNLKPAIIGLLLAISAILLLSFYFRPRPVVSGNNCMVVYVEQNIDGHMEKIEVYDETKILSYLKTCYEQRNLFQNWDRHYAKDDIDLELALFVDGHVKELYLGNFNYSDEGTGSVKWRIQNADEVRLTIRTILGLD